MLCCFCLVAYCVLLFVLYDSWFGVCCVAFDMYCIDIVSHCVAFCIVLWSHACKFRIAPYWLYLIVVQLYCFVLRCCYIVRLCLVLVCACVVLYFVSCCILAVCIVVVCVILF